MLLALVIMITMMPILAQADARRDLLADLEQFRQKSLTLRSEVQRLDAASTLTLSRYLAWTPALNLSAGKTRTELNSVRTTDYDYLRGSVEMNLLRGGSDFFALRSAREAEKAQNLQVQNSELSVELQGARLIFRRLHLLDMFSIQLELLKLKQEALQIGRSRYEQGKIPLQEVTKMEVDLSQQQNVVRQAEIETAANDTAYRSLFVDSLQTREWPLAEGQILALTGGEGSLDTKRLTHLAASSEASWKSVRSLHLPSLDFSLTYDKFPLKTRVNDTWTGTLALSFPLWSRLETAASSARAHSDFVAAENTAAAAAREEELRREFLRKKISLSQANLLEARHNREKSDRLYNDMLRTFQLGRLSTNDLFQEQNRKILSQISYTQSRLNYHESVAEACSLWGLALRDCLKL